MKYIIVFAFCIFAVCAFSQEKFLLPVDGVQSVDSFMNAASVNGEYAVLPSPVGNGRTYVLYFDLGYWMAPNTLITANIYGYIPGGSKMLFAAIVDEAGQGFRHRDAIPVMDYYTHFNSMAVISHRWNFPVRHLCLIRECASSSAIMNSDGTITPSKPEWENGRDVMIDAVSIGKKKTVAKCNAFNWRTTYGGFIINSNLFGKTLERK